MFENRVLRRIFGHKEKEVARSCRELHNELHSLYSSPNVIRVIRSRRMIWAGHVALMGEIGKCIQQENLKGRGHWDLLGVIGRLILELILEKQVGTLWTRFIWLSIGTSDGLLGTW
jgi:hypothetical protein